RRLICALGASGCDRRAKACAARDRIGDLNMATALKAAFIGLGAMGWPMAGQLKSRGLLAAVANRSADKAKAFAAEHGVVAPAALAELAAICNVIALCVSADDDVLGVVREVAAAAKPGTIIVDHSTVSPQTAKRAHEMMRKAGGDFLDAPVSGGVEGAK